VGLEKEKRDPLQVSGRQANNPAHKGEAAMFDLMPHGKRFGKDVNFHRVERTSGSFCRMLELPAEVNPKTIDATYKKGVLKLVFKKTKAF
jgi:hypothetical protein